MVQGRGCIILALFFYILCSTSQPVDVLRSPDGELLEEFYTVHTGEMDGSAKEEYDRIRDELKAVKNKLENISKQVGTINVDRGSVQEEYESYETDRKMFRALKKQYKYGKKLEKRGIKGWFINERGFEKLLGKNGTQEGSSPVNGSSWCYSFSLPRPLRMSGNPASGIYCVVRKRGGVPCFLGNTFVPGFLFSS